MVSRRMEQREPQLNQGLNTQSVRKFHYRFTTKDLRLSPKRAARIPPTTTNEAGLDVNIVIQ